MKKFLSTKSDFLGKEFKLNNRRLAVEDVIAEGGFSIVFLVYCEADGKHYALKRLFVNEDSKLMMCRQEIDITRKLSGHKNIAECLDACITAVGNDVNEVLILLQYYKTSILDEMNERLNRRYTESEVLKIFCDVCEAVSSLHHNAVPIIHRDLKIENLLRDGKGNVRLCDFGSATFKVLNPLVDGIGAVSDELQKYTTLQYRSPEMVDLYSYQSISFKSDIWALGCLLYRLCFFTNCFGDSVMAISNGQFTVPDDCPYSDRLLKLIKYMLQTDPDDRPDIYQVSHLAFTLANKFQCPISNFNNSKVPSFDNLAMPLKDSELRSSRTKLTRNIEQSEKSAVGTSINPRERPRVQVPTNPPVKAGKDASKQPPHPTPSSSSSSSLSLISGKLIEIDSNATPTSTKPDIQTTVARDQQHRVTQHQQQPSNHFDPFGLAPMNLKAATSTKSSPLVHNSTAFPHHSTAASTMTSTLTAAGNHNMTPTIPEEPPLIDLNPSNCFEDSFLVETTNAGSATNPFKQQLQNQQHILQPQQNNKLLSSTSNTMNLNQYVPQTIPQFRYQPTGQSYAATPAFTYNQPMGLNYANNVINNNSMFNINTAINQRPSNNLNNNMLTLSQNLIGSHDNNFNNFNVYQETQQQPYSTLYKHRRNVSDTSALTSNYHTHQQQLLQQQQNLQQQQYISQQQRDLLQQQQLSQPQMLLQCPQISQQFPNQPHTLSRSNEHTPDVMRTSFSNNTPIQPQQITLQQINNNNIVGPFASTEFMNRNSIFDQFDELTLRHSHSFSTISEGHVQQTATVENQLFQNDFPCHFQHNNVEKHANNDNSVDLFGEIPFNKMVTNLKTRHQQRLEMGHKRSVSDFK